MTKEEISSKNFEALPVERVFQILESSNDGLAQEEASSRLKVFGGNYLKEAARVPKADIVLNQLKSPLIYVLLFAGLVTFVLQDFKSSLFIFIAVLINAGLGFYQENKAETAIQQLKSYIKEKVRVVREGVEMEVPSEELVPGDVVRLFPGSRVPADGRLTLVDEFSVDESILTGESLSVTDKTNEPVSKESILSERKSMVFAGTLVEGGVGIMVVTATGTDTEFGKIAKAVLVAEREKTPLQLSLGRFTWRATVFLGILTLILFFFGIYSGHRPFEMFLISVAIAVSAVPEGLPIALTVILSVGVQRLAKRKGIVRKLLAAETLGSTTLILTDKTGTLTEGKMELSQIISSFPKEEVLSAALLNTDVIVENLKDLPDKWRIIGRPLEAALVRSAAKHEVFLSKDKVKFLKIVPFNSADKFSAVYLESGKEKFWNYVGAPEVLLEKSNLEASEKSKILKKLDELAYAGYRVIGILRDNSFYGLIAFRDNPRPGIKEIFKRISDAGVRTIMVTGDHQGTAEALFKEMGTNVRSDEVIIGDNLRKLSDQDLKAKLGQIKIFARVTPEDKLRLAKLYMEIGEVVAVTGDGVNDAPALKSADIGVALGSGVDVSKGVADLVILDDNFQTMVAAIEEGRRILDNTKKVIVYFLADSFSELFLIGGSIILGIPLPLNALQILWVNFFTDSFPATALAFENGKDHLRFPPPEVRNELFSSQIKFLILVIGTLSSLILFVVYFGLLKLGFEEVIVRTFIFASFSLYALFLIFSIRDLQDSIFSYNFFANPYLVLSVAFGIVLTLGALYFRPLGEILGTVPLPPVWLLGVFALGFFNIALIELGKLLFRR